MQEFTKDPDDDLDYEVDHTDWLGDDTIDTSTWIVPSGLTQHDDEIQAGNLKTLVWLTGGVDGTDYIVTNRIVTAAGRTRDKSFKLLVRETTTEAAAPTDAEIIAEIDAEIAANPGGIIEYELQDQRRVKKMSLKELLQVRAQLAAREFRRDEGMFGVARVNRPC